jgi:hypothetical protein
MVLKKTYKLWLGGKPVLLNRLLSTQAKHQSRIKKQGNKDYFGIQYIWQQLQLQGIPKFTKPVKLQFIIHHSNLKTYDVDAPLKTVLDGIKQSPENPLGLVDDGRTGIKSITIEYKKWDCDGIQIVFKMV